MNQEESSFTLIELLVVIAIVGILAGILIVSMTGATNNANDARRKADINQIVKELLIYNTSNPAYPIETCSIGSNCSTALNTILGNAVNMKDPKGTYYVYSSDGTNFTISAALSDSSTYTYNSTNSKYTASTGSPCVSGGGLTCSETSVGGYKIDKYTATSGTTTGTFNWVTPIGVNQVEVLVVAGGGGGGYDQSGGGGAGGLVYKSTHAVTSGNSYTVTVGKGGTGSVAATTGTNGDNSVFDTITALGGGKAGGRGTGSPAAGTSGGSGGGAGNWSGDQSGGSALQGPSGGGTGYGNAGGSHSGDLATGSAGGGGAGGVGGPNSGNQGGNGGVGLAFSITGTSIYYAGGGGGTSRLGTNPTGGNGGGGAGGANDDGKAGGNGTDGFGGGGGGGSGYYGLGGRGGSGVVIIKYLAP